MPTVTVGRLRVRIVAPIVLGRSIASLPWDDRTVGQHRTLLHADRPRFRPASPEHSAAPAFLVLSVTVLQFAMAAETVGLTEQHFLSYCRRRVTIRNRRSAIDDALFLMINICGGYPPRQNGATICENLWRKPYCDRQVLPS